LNNDLRLEKNLVYFIPQRFVVQNCNSAEALRNRAIEALSIISKGRKELSSGFETYYSLWMNDDKMLLLSNNFEIIDFINLAALASWKKILNEHN
jgi:hypothetical protein